MSDFQEEDGDEELVNVSFRDRMPQFLLVAANLSWVVTGFFLYSGSWYGVFASALVAYWLQRELLKLLVEEYGEEEDDDEVGVV